MEIKQKRRYQKNKKQELKNKIYYLYYKKGLTIIQIANLLLMSEKTISKYLMELDNELERYSERT
jgi:DNA-binding transcriptional regulator LsrR (DeoR family)